MSSHELLEVECPSCRAKQDIVIWKSLNVTRDPELKEQFFTGKINYFTCGSCDFEGFITAPLVYDDMEKKICANYVPIEYLEDEEYLKQSFTPDAEIRLELPDDTARIAEMDYFRHAHMVFSMAELIRYVLFRDRLGQVFSEN
ncbi:MAG: CpXC domain-containing protein [Methanoregula sp.]|nr:CpXC domain-containing protein [Methanoregula sp.]